MCWQIIHSTNKSNFQVKFTSLIIPILLPLKFLFKWDFIFWEHFWDTVQPENYIPLPQMPLSGLPRTSFITCFFLLIVRKIFTSGYTHWFDKIETYSFWHLNQNVYKHCCDSFIKWSCDIIHWHIGDLIVNPSPIYSHQGKILKKNTMLFKWIKWWHWRWVGHNLRKKKPAKRTFLLPESKTKERKVLTIILSSWLNATSDLI